jgi:hypothetical protein
MVYLKTLRTEMRAKIFREVEHLEGYHLSVVTMCSMLEGQVGTLLTEVRFETKERKRRGRGIEEKKLWQQREVYIPKPEQLWPRSA